MPDKKPAESNENKKVSREIKGNLPYLASPNAISKVLSAAIEAERPEKFTANWMEAVLNLSGGANRPVIPFLKKMGFLTSDGTPTERYSKFKTESGRGDAVFGGLQDAFSELFRKNEVAHKADEDKIKDIIVEITGLTKSDSIVRLIYNSFDNLREFLPAGFSQSKTGSSESDKTKTDADEEEFDGEASGRVSGQLGLSYHINLVLPETDDQAILDAIFKSIKRNLL